MKITKADLNTQFNSQIPIDVRVTNGYTNVVLALWKDSNYCKSNTYLPKWQVVNADYYNANRVLGEYGEGVCRNKARFYGSGEVAVAFSSHSSVKAA